MVAGGPWCIWACRCTPLQRTAPPNGGEAVNTQREGSRNGQRKVRPTGSEQTAGGPSKGQWESGVGGQAKAAQTQREAKGKATAQQWQANERAVERKREARRRAGTRVGNQVRKSPQTRPQRGRSGERRTVRVRLVEAVALGAAGAVHPQHSAGGGGGRCPAARCSRPGAVSTAGARGRGEAAREEGAAIGYPRPQERAWPQPVACTPAAALSRHDAARDVSVCVSFSLCAVPVISGDFG